MTLPESRPWRGVLVATAIPLREDLTVDFDAYAEHCAWLVGNGCDGVVPNGSLGEYQVLTAEERAGVVETAVAAIGGARVMPGVAAYGSAEARRWAEQAAEAGCASVMLLPPNSYRADERSVLAHYAEVARAGLPVVAYNNPIDTKVDLVPELLARLHGEGHIHGVKEFSGDVRRAYRLAELAPERARLLGAGDGVGVLGVGGGPGGGGGGPPPRPAARAP
ncbi:dihydrodipicolinate synthase family protein, partial [Streptomyces sp. NPDC058964]|uniref:dihydrodipicolinate synthase family protein n=1 Tax=Streptomyces sp. NPDC058964 TaxID=3346681 RepID=UPI0036D0AA36